MYLEADFFADVLPSSLVDHDHPTAAPGEQFVEDSQNSEQPLFDIDIVSPSDFCSLIKEGPLTFSITLVQCSSPCMLNPVSHPTLSTLATLTSFPLIFLRLTPALPMSLLIEMLTNFLHEEAMITRLN
jgi:hypothetical protein